MNCRGIRANPSQNALYGVFDNLLVRIDHNGTRTALGLLNSSTGYVDFAFGTRQLVVVDGANGYVHTLANNAFARITSPAWRGSRRVGYVKGVFIFHDPGTGVPYWSAIEDGADLDILDFITASNSPDDVVAILDDHGEATFLGEVSTEVWSYTGGDPAFERNPGADTAVGCLGAFTARTLGNERFWLGRDPTGAVRVYAATGYVPVPVSDDALDAKLAAAIRGGADMSKAIAFGQAEGSHGFYWLNVPGFPTTWVYDTKERAWHERSEFRYGQHERHRAKFHAYCFGRHIVGGTDSDDLWELDRTAPDNAGDPLVHDRVSPHYSLPTGKPIKFGPFELDCKVGAGGEVAMRYSDDGGKTWGPWRSESLGDLGKFQQRVRWFGNGASTDRVWQVRSTHHEFTLVRALVQGR